MFIGLSTTFVHQTDHRILFMILQSLIQELDAERERRWKAEQAARKMVDAIKELQLKGFSPFSVLSRVVRIVADVSMQWREKFSLQTIVYLVRFPVPKPCVLWVTFACFFSLLYSEKLRDTPVSLPGKKNYALCSHAITT